MVHTFLLALVVALFGVERAKALTTRTLVVDLGSSAGLSTIIGNVISTLAATIVIFVTVLFLIGAFIMVTSRGGESLAKAKDLMLQSLIGMAVVLTAYALLRTLFWLIYIA